jgi:hypothetical protein
MSIILLAVNWLGVYYCGITKFCLCVAIADLLGVLDGFSNQKFFIVLSLYCSICEA